MVDAVSLPVVIAVIDHVLSRHISPTLRHTVQGPGNGHLVGAGLHDLRRRQLLRLPLDVEVGDPAVEHVVQLARAARDVLVAAGAVGEMSPRRQAGDGQAGLAERSADKVTHVVVSETVSVVMTGWSSMRM